MSGILAFVGRHPRLRSIAGLIGQRFPRFRALALRTVADLTLWRSGGLRPGGRPHDPARSTVLLCVHEGNLTGAPVLGWNLARELGKQQNVIVVLLRGGELLAEFLPLCCALVAPAGRSIADADPGAFERKILRPARAAYGLSGVVANSVECEIAATAAARAGVPAVALIHEFAEYTSAIRLERMVASGAALAFSSQLQLQSIERALGRELAGARVLPQGKSEIPTLDGRPPGALDGFFTELASDGSFLCIGLGFVQARKGVDLFIATAIQLLRSGVNARFLWVGDGYDPVGDFQVGVWLADQIVRSGFADRIAIVPAIGPADLAALYSHADAMLLSSRLDPLPNVAIDALFAGVPVICFESATGLAEYLAEDEVLGTLVVPYFDTHAAATVLARLAADPDLSAEMANRARAYAAARFNMASYVASIAGALGKAGVWADI